MKIQLQIDQRSLDASKLVMAQLNGVFGKVVSRAINKSLVSVRAAATDEIAKDLNLTKTKIRESFTLKNATQADASGFVTSRSKPIPLIEFSGTRALARGGVSVQVKKTGTREKLLHAFIATMRSGHRGVFERRETIYQGKPWRKNVNYAALAKMGVIESLPIDQLYGPRITDEYAKGPVLAVVQAKADEVYTKNLEHELDYELSRVR